jgi:peptidoglycan hydrolase-like protein with peptidoglycan-binding domain
VPTTIDAPDVPRPDPSHELAFRRSLRASRGRRAAAATRRRRELTGRRGLALALAGLAVAASGAFAADAGTPAGGASALADDASADTVAALQAKLGLTADGIYGPRTRAAVRRFQRRQGLAVDGIAGPQTLSALGVTAADTATAQEASLTSAPSAAVDASRLAAIAQCESGGDPTAISADGRYRGKYQFTRATWRLVGGTGDPAAAPESEQDQRAATLLAKQGPKAWPVCSGTA